MRIFAPVAVIIFTLGANVPVVHSECYGEAAAAYGCGVSVNTDIGKPGGARPGLETFGSTDGPILPDTGYYNQRPHSGDVLTPEERHRMMRSIVLGKSSSSRSKSTQMRAVTSGSRPLRRVGGMPARFR